MKTIDPLLGCRRESVGFFAAIFFGVYRCFLVHLADLLCYTAAHLAAVK